MHLVVSNSCSILCKNFYCSSMICHHCHKCNCSFFTHKIQYLHTSFTLILTISHMFLALLHLHHHNRKWEWCYWFHFSIKAFPTIQQQHINNFVPAAVAFSSLLLSFFGPHHGHMTWKAILQCIYQVQPQSLLWISALLLLERKE